MAQDACRVRVGQSRTICATLLLILLGGGLGCSRQSDGGGRLSPYSISGIISEGGSDRPIGAAEVTFNGIIVASSGGNGGYDFVYSIGHAPGSGVMTVRAFGYREATYDVPADAQADPESEFRYLLNVELEHTGEE